MPFLFALISIINILSVSLILVVCGKKENENNGNTTGKTENQAAANRSNSKEVQLSFSMDQPVTPPKRTDIYHQVAESFAFPASSKCKNHDDAWRILALYLDYIREVNQTDFERFRMLDSALAILHDFRFVEQSVQVSNETLALGVLYFLINYHKIKVNLGSPSHPWYNILCRNAKIEELEAIRLLIKQEMLGIDGSDSGASALEVVPWK
ncbi:hypothetical protein CRE_19619 [Caenorhabditis remanei]|uniref:Uncharacterized protein n=1 Tax=Caenorhabditis remanei TaxID=31234 RepID=E3NV28_CAERE|nr:hypothetical protein CRE_19619 [Caenorhabditis remanei]